jgi:S1-C subfamily serine protease
MTSLIETGKVRRGFLGVETQGLTPDVAENVGLPKDAQGTIVTDVIAGSPASKAGIQRSDVILAINDKPAPTLSDLHFMIGQMLPGAKISLKIMRDSKPITISLLLGAVVDDPDQLLKGVDAVALTDELRRKLELDSSVNGVVITSVAKDSPFVERLEPNMVIVEIGRTPVGDLSTARALLRPGRHLLFVYARGAQEFVPLIVPEDHPEERP